MRISTGQFYESTGGELSEEVRQRGQEQRRGQQLVRVDAARR